MAAPPSGRGPPDMRENRFHAERAKRERQWQLLFTQYTVNPFRPSEASRPQATGVKPGGKRSREGSGGCRGRPAARQGQAAAHKRVAAGPVRRVKLERATGGLPFCLRNRTAHSHLPRWCLL